MLKNLTQKILGVATAVALTLGTAQAATIDITPSNQFAGNGQTINVVLSVSGLTAGGADTLAEFDLDVLFDDTALAFLGYNLMTDLGPTADQIDFSGGDLGGGVLDFAAVSTLSEADLNALQGTTAAILTLQFSVVSLAVGQITNIAIDGNDPFLLLGDALGFELGIDGLNGATITGIDASEIPLPGALPLIISGLGLYKVHARRRKKHLAA